MRRWSCALAVAATFVAMVSIPTSVAGAAGAARYIVVLKDSADPDATARGMTGLTYVPHSSGEEQVKDREMLPEGA